MAEYIYCSIFVSVHELKLVSWVFIVGVVYLMRKKVNKYFSEKIHKEMRKLNKIKLCDLEKKGEKPIQTTEKQFGKYCNRKTTHESAIQPCFKSEEINTTDLKQTQT